MMMLPFNIFLKAFGIWLWSDHQISFAIVNFRVVDQNGHAGTLISAILLLFAQSFRAIAINDSRKQ